MKKDPAVKNKLRLELRARYAHRAIDGKQMHEFPFNATQQANVDDSSVQWVDPIQNHLQGSVYFGSWFVRRQLRSQDGAAFVVVPIPDSILGN
jgi:hypothetical protein